MSIVEPPASGTDAQPQPTPAPAAANAPSSDTRRANAYLASTQFLADPNNRREPILALVSFQRGLSVSEAVGELKRRAPDAIPEAVTSVITDATGQRHLMSVRIQAGEDIEDKVTRFNQGQVASIRDQAQRLLSCTGQACPPLNDQIRRDLSTKANLDAKQARVYGVAVRGSANVVDRLVVRNDPVIATTEILQGGNPFQAPVLP